MQNSGFLQLNFQPKVCAAGNLILGYPAQHPVPNKWFKPLASLTRDRLKPAP